MSLDARVAATAQHGPWNPGLDSDIPAELLAHSTIFRSDNVSSEVGPVIELRALTGLKFEELAVFRPDRLVVHELLIRVTADLSVPDGPRVEDLGINFRRVTHTLLTRHIAPRMGEIVAQYEAARNAIAEAVARELRVLFPPLSSPGVARVFSLLSFRRADAVRTGHDDDWLRGNRVLREWSAAAGATDSALMRAVYEALIRVVSAVRAKHGRMWGDAALLSRLAAGIACNEHGSAVIGALIDPIVKEAATKEDYALLPAQSEPVVMNTKGASASGKSTLRPLQRKLATEIGVDWNDFALISPDIWRKYLLDYGTLGEAYKYAGAFTGHELAIIDHKLDRYMARKAEASGMSHLLIDRFRFDSFAPDSEEAGSNLLTRFGNLVYMFFLITPPHETVERSWRRGLDVGRYKAVDDLLAHNVEAYTGMPELFFTWVLRDNKRVHYEFLDNDVPYGERPRSIAFGWNGEMNVLDVKCMLDIDRYRKINVNARQPAEVYPDARAMAPANNAAFLAQCARMLPAINFAERGSGRIYARLEQGRLAWSDPDRISAALADAETRAGLLAVAPDLLGRVTAGGARQAAPRAIAAGQYHTLGRWGPGTP
ncbi:MAG: hypothetical protein ACT4P8_06685 [Betaproteobacteria bacterium]